LRAWGKKLVCLRQKSGQKSGKAREKRKFDEANNRANLLILLYYVDTAG